MVSQFSTSNFALLIAAGLSLVVCATATVSERSGSKLTQAEAQARLLPGITTFSSGHCVDKYVANSFISTVVRLITFAPFLFLVRSIISTNLRTKPSCTSLDGIFSGTIDGVNNLKKQSGASILITGGTETGHASGTHSHANGFKVDLEKNTKLNNFIKNTFKRIANRGDGFPQWQDTAGNLYCVSTFSSISHCFHLACFSLLEYGG